MKTLPKIGLVLFVMLLLAGITACERAEKAMDDVTKSAKETVDTAKIKALEVLNTAEENGSVEGESQEKEEKQED